MAIENLTESQLLELIRQNAICISKAKAALKKIRGDSSS